MKVALQLLSFQPENISTGFLDLHVSRFLRQLKLLLFFGDSAVAGIRDVALDVLNQEDASLALCL